MSENKTEFDKVNESVKKILEPRMKDNSQGESLNNFLYMGLRFAGEGFESFGLSSISPHGMYEMVRDFIDKNPKYGAIMTQAVLDNIQECGFLPIEHYETVDNELVN